MSRVPAQTNLTIGARNDPWEQEADRVANQVVAKLERDPIGNAPPHIQRISGHAVESMNMATASVERVISAGGSPLEPALRHDMEESFGSDFSSVRIHTGAAPAQSARDVNARAYTVGNNIVFGVNSYDPHSLAGRHLLAHELAHTVQQSAGGRWLQRRLLVDGPLNAADPAAAIPQATRATMMQSLLQQLCPGFNVRSAGAVHEVFSTVATFCTDVNGAAGPGHPVGCCCLCTLVDSPNTWTLRVTTVDGASTDPINRVVQVPPTGAATTRVPMHWSGGGVGGEHLVESRPEITLGHELCGHAALNELHIHPVGLNRTQSDTHDPTIRTQNAIAAEMGQPASAARGLAASPIHRGESVNRTTVKGFALNSEDTATLPAAELGRISDAAAYIMAPDNQMFVSVTGHSDSAGQPWVKESIALRRARSVRDKLRALGVTDRFEPRDQLIGGGSIIRVPGQGVVNRFTLVEGRSDSEPPPGNPPPEEWRRAEIFMARFPAGAHRPPPRTPTRRDHAAEEDPAILATRKAGSPCERRIANTAWP